MNFTEINAMQTKSEYLSALPVLQLSAGRKSRIPDLMPSVRGFTLVELMVTVAVAAIMLAIAVPSFTYLIQSNILTTASNDLIVNLNYAHSEAGKKGTATYVCTNSDCRVCADSACTSVLHAGVPNLSNGQANGRSVQPLVYNYQGIASTTTATSPYTGLVADIYSTRISSNAHRCVYMTAGSALSTCSDSANCGTGAPNATCK